MSHTIYWQHYVITCVYNSIHLWVVTGFSNFMACTFRPDKHCFFKYIPNNIYHTEGSHTVRWYKPIREWPNCQFCNIVSNTLHPIPYPTHSLPHSFPFYSYYFCVIVYSSTKLLRVFHLSWYSRPALSHEKVHSSPVTCLQPWLLKAKSWTLCRQHNRCKKLVAIEGLQWGAPIPVIVAPCSPDVDFLENLDQDAVPKHDGRLPKHKKTSFVESPWLRLKNASRELTTHL